MFVQHHQRASSGELPGRRLARSVLHNGMSATLADVVEHYNTIDNIGLTDGEKADLAAL
jgi:hypothetical protein